MKFQLEKLVFLSSNLHEMKRKYKTKIKEQLFGNKTIVVRSGWSKKHKKASWNFLSSSSQTTINVDLMKPLPICVMLCSVRRLLRTYSQSRDINILSTNGEKARQSVRWEEQCVTLWKRRKKMYRYCVASSVISAERQPPKEHFIVKAVYSCVFGFYNQLRNTSYKFEARCILEYKITGFSFIFISSKLNLT